MLLSIILFLGCAQANKKNESKNTNNIKSNISWIPIKWIGGESGGKHYDKLSMEIPILLNDSIEHFAQFDLGANTDMLYEPTLKNYYNIKEVFNIDTVGTENYYYWLRNPNIKIGNKNTAVKDWVVRTDYDAEGVIGTIGAEELKERILIIDFPNDKLAILDSITENHRNQYKYLNFELVNNKVIVDIRIGNKTYEVNFDTGSSITPLFVSDYKLFKEITNNKIGVDTLKQFVSWGKTIESIPGAYTKEKLIIGDKDFGHQMVYYFDSEYHRNLFKQDRIVALMGSILFFKNEILIDFKARKLGIKFPANN